MSYRKGRHVFVKLVNGTTLHGDITDYANRSLYLKGNKNNFVIPLESIVYVTDNIDGIV